MGPGVARASCAVQRGIQGVTISMSERRAEQVGAVSGPSLGGGLMRASVPVLIASALAGCSSAAREQLRSRAEFDLQCPMDQLSLVSLGENSKGVIGCGKRATYVLTPSGWIMN